MMILPKMDRKAMDTETIIKMVAIVVALIIMFVVWNGIMKRLK